MKTKLLVTCAAALMLTSVLPQAAFAGGDSQDAVRNLHMQPVVDRYGKCVRTKWMVDSDACAPAQPVAAAPVKKRRVIGLQERTVYFDFNKTNLRPDARTRLDTLATALKSDADIKQAKVVGYADRVGTPSYNEKLSRKRADTVRQYLISQGYANANSTETRWFGEQHPATNCPDTLKRSALIECLQTDRRVEVEIEYLPEGRAPAQR